MPTLHCAERNRRRDRRASANSRLGLGTSTNPFEFRRFLLSMTSSRSRRKQPHPRCEVRGTVWGFGGDVYGQMTSQQNTSILSPRDLGITNAVDIAAGVYESLILHADGSVTWLGMGKRPNPVNLAVRASSHR